MSTDNRGSDFKFQSILLQSDRLSGDIEMKNNVSDVEIYEHIDKPYLTGKLLFIDNQNVLQEVDFLGGETITITIKSFREDSIPITNKFYISKVIGSKKVNDNTQAIVFHLVEDIGYISNLQYVNRFYSGKITEILNKLSTNYFNGKQVDSNRKDFGSKKLITPNLTPLETALWLTRTAKTKEGYPFFLYSSLVGDKLHFKDLGTMLSSTVVNPDVSYTYLQGTKNSKYPDISRRGIREYKTGEGANLLDLIEQNIVGSKYEYINSVIEDRDIFQFDILKDVFKPLVDQGILQKNQNNPPFSPRYKFKEKSFNELDTSYIAMLGGSCAYKESETAKDLAYNEEEYLSDYKAKVISHAMQMVLRTEPLSVVIDGVDFIDGKFNSTIGNTLRMEFGISNPEPGKSESRLDKRISGDYLMFAAKHMFKKERYDLAMTCVKLGNYRR